MFHKLVRQTHPSYHNVIQTFIIKELQNGASETTLSGIFLNHQDTPGIGRNVQ